MRQVGFKFEGYPLSYDRLYEARKAKAFFSYLGSKRRLAKWIALHFPKGIEHYYEPFVGGGSVFWHVRGNFLAQEYTISDICPAVYCHYVSLRDHFNELMDELACHSEKHSLLYFHESKERLKDLINSEIYNVETSALDIYTRQTILYSRGGTPKKNGEYPFNVKKEILNACHVLIQGVNICKYNYTHISPVANDVVYCDPPYTGVSQIQYRKYKKRGRGFTWGSNDDRALAENARVWNNNGAFVGISGIVCGEWSEGSINSHSIGKHLSDWEVSHKLFYHRAGRMSDKDRPITNEVLIFNG